MVHFFTIPSSFLHHFYKNTEKNRSRSKIPPAISMADTTHHLGQLPGFRFHPTEEELLDFYLKHMVFGHSKRGFDVIGFLNIYKHDPWDLPDLAKNGEREWYFFVPRDRKHGGCGGGRPNRTTGIGYWKATGSDRRIISSSESKRLIGLRKTLVFYKGRAPRGTKTDWVMNEYRLPENSAPPADIVLCKIYRKATSLKVLEQRAAEEEMRNPVYSPEEETGIPAKKEVSGEEEVDSKGRIERWEAAASSTTSLQIPKGFEMLTDLQVPKMNVDWTQDQFWNQLNSPWLLNLIATPNNNILNF